MPDHPDGRDRLFTLPAGGTTLHLPAFFPSISSLKGELSSQAFLSLILSVDHPLLLVSAFDIYYAESAHRRAIYAMLQDAHERRTVVLLDSGRYESYWSRGQAWSAASLARVLRRAPCPLAFCFDEYNGPRTSNGLATEVDKAVARDQRASKNATILPIIHGSPAILPALTLKVAQRLHPLMIAVPERDLGEGLLERASNVTAIRRALGRIGRYIPIHLLGTGSPISILTYTLAGADSFDGLAWSNTAIDHATARQYHFHQAELLDSRFLPIPLSGEAYTETTLINNLVFYGRWLHTIRDALLTGKLDELAASYIPEPILDHLRRL